MKIDPKDFHLLYRLQRTFLVFPFITQLHHGSNQHYNYWWYSILTSVVIEKYNTGRTGCGLRRLMFNDHWPAAVSISVGIDPRSTKVKCYTNPTTKNCTKTKDRIETKEHHLKNVKKNNSMHTKENKSKMWQINQVWHDYAGKPLERNLVEVNSNPKQCHKNKLYKGQSWYKNSKCRLCGNKENLYL